MIDKSLKVLSLFVLLSLQGASAMAQESLHCDLGSGVWRQTPASPVLDGVLCATDKQAEANFYRIEFDTKKVSSAPAIPHVSGELRYLFDTPQSLFYADDTSVYEVSPETFKVLSQNDWQGAKSIDLGPEAKDYRAIWSAGKEASELHLLQWVNGKMTEVLNAQLSPEPPIAIVWQPKRLIVLEPHRVLFWINPNTEPPEPEKRPNENDTQKPDNTPQPTDPDSEQPLAMWDALPLEAEITPPLTPGHYQLDAEGLMVLQRENKRLSYFRFEQASWTPATINATAQIHSLGQGTTHAMGVTYDLNTVRIVARGGIFLKNRFEAKYWKLPQDPAIPAVLGEHNLAALDGGPHHRVQTIDTTDMTWRRLATIQYPTPGRMAEIKNGILTTIHDTGTDAMILWNARSGQKIISLENSKLEAIQFGKLQDVVTIDAFPRYKCLTGQNQQFVLFDQETGNLSAPAPAHKNQWDKLPSALQILSEGIAIQRHSDTGTSWDIYPKSGASYRRTIEGFTQATQTELQNPHEKWYGYCVNDKCYASNAQDIDVKRAIPTITTQASEKSHAPGYLSWLLTALSILGMFGVMLWRRGTGKKSQLKGNETFDALVHDIYDHKNRRYISNRDYCCFLAPRFYAKPVFRILLSIILGLGSGLAIAASSFFDDTVLTFMSWVIVLGMPISAITWIVTSWTFWNRYYLLRFGCITEGKWLNSDQSNPSIIYATTNDKLYELNRRQWQKVDFVPMVIFDPARPNFAIQYTGGCSHATLPQRNLDKTASPACSFDMRRLFVVALLLAGCIAATQTLFYLAYPNPISAWRLDNIAQAATQENADMTFTMACLDECDETDATCHLQCHQRQLRIVLEQAGSPLTTDPNISAAQFLQTHSQNVENARQILFDTSHMSCAEREAKLSEITLWPDALNQSFWQTYSHEETFKKANLNGIYKDLKTNADLFQTLCDADNGCAQNAQNCPPAPACTGNMAKLKKRVCAIKNALHIPQVAPTPTK